jgi:N-acetyl-gamma-glutamyl-phosphate reductase
MTKVFIDGTSGTTGLNIRERLSAFDNINLITLKEEFRKDRVARKDAINSADVVFLCLPDDAAKEAVLLVDESNKNTAIIDASTAHRTNENWVYGFAEIKGQKEKIKSSKRIANPGRHASGFISLVRPLIDEGVLDKNTYLTAFSITGYTGGGKNMIKEYEEDMPFDYIAPRQYGLTQMHKHIPEMMKIGGLEVKPSFCPIVSSFPRGMEVSIPLNKDMLTCGLEDLKDIYKNYYTGNIVKFVESSDEKGFLTANKLAGKDSLEISVFGNNDNILLVSRFDNLGKGAGGAAIQNMNLLINEDENKGLIL